MQTFWAEPLTNAPTVGSLDLADEEGEPLPEQIMNDKTTRLVNWNVDTLAHLIRQIVARRQALQISRQSISPVFQQGSDSLGTVLDEVKEIIELPPFDPAAARRQKDPKTIKLDQAVIDELKDYVTAIANMYRYNPFHNFEHASHGM